MSELSEAGDALNLARSRFDNAQFAVMEARLMIDEAQRGYWDAWAEMEQAADEWAAAARLVLHEQTIAGER